MQMLLVGLVVGGSSRVDVRGHTDLPSTERADQRRTRPSEGKPILRLWRPRARRPGRQTRDPSREQKAGRDRPSRRDRGTQATLSGNFGLDAAVLIVQLGSELVTVAVGVPRRPDRHSRRTSNGGAYLAGGPAAAATAGRGRGGGRGAPSTAAAAGAASGGRTTSARRRLLLGERHR